MCFVFMEYALVEVSRSKRKESGLKLSIYPMTTLLCELLRYTESWSAREQ